jgi:NAD(P)-dependent dehydrogenase (short-subunit alcohol dehydrogenase family)
MTETNGRRVALVTGAGGGIGRAICLRLSSDGLAVAAVDINLDAASTTVDLVAAAGGTAAAVRADLTKRDEIAAAFDEAERQLGKVTALVNNAGALSIGPFVEISEAEWDRIMDVNVKAPFFVTQEYARRLAGTELGGAVVNIGSVAGVHAMMNRAHYCASKGASRP